MKCKTFFATLMGFALLFASGCKTDVEPASSKGKEDAKTPVPVLISYDSRELTCCIDEGVAVSGSTVMSGTELTIIPAEGEPVLFLTVPNNAKTAGGNLRFLQQKRGEDNEKEN